MPRAVCGKMTHFKRPEASFKLKNTVPVAILVAPETSPSTHTSGNPSSISSFIRRFISETVKIFRPSSGRPVKKSSSSSGMFFIRLRNVLLLLGGLLRRDSREVRRLGLSVLRSRGSGGRFLGFRLEREQHHGICRQFRRLFQCPGTGNRSFLGRRKNAILNARKIRHVFTRQVIPFYVLQRDMLYGCFLILLLSKLGEDHLN